MNIFPLICFVSGILANFAGIYVLLVNRKSKLHRSWFFFNLFISIWLIGLGATMVVNSERIAIFFQKILYVGTILIPVYFVDFSAILINKGKRAKNIFRINLLFAIFFLIILLTTNLFVKGLKLRTNFGYWPFEVGRLYYLFLLWFGILVIYGFSLLIKGYRETELGNIRKQQILFFFLGSLIGFSAGSLNFLLDFNIIIPPYYNFLVPFYLIFVGYAIIKHHLFDIKLILTELLVGIFSILLFIQMLLSGSVLEYIWNIVIFIIFLFFGYLFIKNILKEIAIKQKIGEASWRVLEQGEKVSENFKKVMADRKKLLEKWFLSDVNKELEMNDLRKRIKELEEGNK
jgi:hypothetical protein